MTVRLFFFVLRLLVIELSVLLRFTASDYPFGTLKLVLKLYCDNQLVKDS